jgi:hypothetical protein
MRVLIFFILFSLQTHALTFKSDGTVVDNDGNLIDQTNQDQSNQNSTGSYNLNFKTNFNIGEAYVNNLGDMNGDNTDDFLLSLMVDPSAYGAQFYDIDKETAEQLPRVPSYLVYSNDDGKYSYEALPEETWSKRMWAVEGFKIDDRSFILLGRNGEVGKPEENPGEKIAVIEVNFNKTVPNFVNIFFEEKNTVTAALDTFNSDDGSTYLAISNYNMFSTKPYNVYNSVIYKFDPNDGFSYSNLVPYAKDKNAHNGVRILDFDNNGQLDFLAAAEIWKTIDLEAKPMSQFPGSYAVLNWLDKKENLIIRLEPRFEFDHAGSDLNVLNITDQKYLIETSSQFLGHLSKDVFKNSALSIYKMNQVENYGTLNISQTFDLGLIRATQSKTFLYDYDKDGKEEIFINNFMKKRNYFDLIDNKWEEVPLEYSLISNSRNQMITSVLLENKDENCAVLASTYLYQKTKTVKLHISDCL